jgi:type I restriction-modification system DNA methylase subunit
MGELYMELEMFNKWRGQFFTPITIAEFMSRVIFPDIAGLVKEKGYISVNEPCCGSGVMLIAICKTAMKQDVNYQQSILFVAQDLDPVVAQMSYIQMSLMGLAGYVIVGNTLTGDYKSYDYWYTPMYFNDIWRSRRLIKRFNSIVTSTQEGVSTETEKPAKEEYDIVLEEDKFGQLRFAF